jgi:hypothetical protein
MTLSKIVTNYRERPTAFNGFWMFLAEVTGIMENHCRKRHQQYHSLHQVQYNGESIVVCSHCPRSFWR